MRYLIFSDLHSNLESLQAFSRIAATLDHDKKVFLGDLVGYCADPNACVEWVRENADIILGGNHDFAVVGKTGLTYFNPHAYQACLWTRQELSEENKAFLMALPCEIEEDGVTWVHSSPFEPDQWHYVNSCKDGKINFDHFLARLCFLGHSHRPVILEQGSDGVVKDYISSFRELDPECRYIVNVGSLGQPRDGNPQPSFVVYDSDAATIEFQRYEYDFESTQKKILAAGLPFPLADRLRLGM
ncbi:MAG: metallophosphoesterase family protein [Nitrospinae bacterium]|jgi:predicted phosphodiesterase|nr:metallophosphoesterase family protein [Nitrospinota bacterium]MDA1109300.1 metallophosphoesterase family protein [Nitrospinota bacterium]